MGVDREKVIKWLEICKNPHGRCAAECPYDDGEIDFTNCTSVLCGDALALLKEQESWINEIAEYQQSISGSGMHELDDYEKGKWDGLQIAWNIISEGR